MIRCAKNVLRMLLLLRKSLNSCVINWGPLSDTISSGRPWVVNTKRKACMVASVVVLGMRRTSKPFDLASTISRNDSFRNGAQ